MAIFFLCPSKQFLPISFQIQLCVGAPRKGPARVQHMIQLRATTAVQTGFYLPLYSVLFYSAFLWSGYVAQKNFNKPAV
jgi:hypothetical protein